MACESCEQRRKAMKAWINQKAEAARHWARVRAGEFDAKPTANVQPEHAEGEADTQAEGSGQASKASVTDRQQDMATDAGTGVDTGRLPMPELRKAGRAKRTR